jgi:hypothetical protein
MQTGVVSGTDSSSPSRHTFSVGYLTDRELSQNANFIALTARVDEQFWKQNTAEIIALTRGC